MLEKPIEDAQTGKVIIPEDGEVREKIVLAYRGTDYFDVLPEGWVEVTHSSGLPIYLVSFFYQLHQIFLFNNNFLSINF